MAHSVTSDWTPFDYAQDRPFIHATADVSSQAAIGPGVKIWHQAQVREGAHVGANCIVGKGAYIDFGVTIGDNVKIQNGVYVYHGVTIEDGVFLGPGVILTNDKHPRAVNPDGSLKTDADWEVSSILIQEGASVGAGAVILPGVTVGRFAMVGAGAVVTRDVPAHGLVHGNPARLQGYVCRCGWPLRPHGELSISHDYAQDRPFEQAEEWKCEVCDECYTF